MSARTPIQAYFFALVVVRLGRRFLLVHERKHGQLWYLPAGRVEPGESLIDAARRETLEESGVPIDLTGILRIEHQAHADGVARVRVFFLGHPRDDTPPKTQPDHESLGAAWVALDELPRHPLRGPEVREIFRIRRSRRRGLPAGPAEARRGALAVIKRTNCTRFQTRSLPPARGVARRWHALRASAGRPGPVHLLSIPTLRLSKTVRRAFHRNPRSPV